MPDSIVRSVSLSAPARGPPLELVEQEVREAGMVRLATAVPEINPAPSFFNPEGRVIFTSAVQPEKALLPISVTLEGKITLVIERLFTKALYSTLVTV